MTLDNILNMPYVDFMAYIKETNRAPWWEKMLLELAKTTFLNDKKKILHVACNTWSSLRELSLLSQCQWVGIDINENMVKVANDLKENEPLVKDLLDYEVMDGQDLQFSDWSFDVTFTTWWMAFIPDKKKWVQELIRVAKDGWFVADFIMYYKNNPPDYLIDEMNNLMHINIQKWDKSYWVNLYTSEWLSLFHEYEWDYQDVSQEKLLNYCRIMSKNRTDITEDERLLIEYKLYWIMSLFAENHKYLWASLLVFRKKTKNDQISLFS